MFVAEHISYSQTNLFSRIIIDYLDNKDTLQPFFNLYPSKENFKKIIQQKKEQKVDREALVAVLKDQYKEVPESKNVLSNIDLLTKPTTFTITTAHQPNLFTGPLYFVYKILHVIKLVKGLKKQFSGTDFIPVYYMGSEDADFAELNHFTVYGKSYAWNTNQKGAVGRMIIDKNLIALIDELEQQISIEPFGAEIIKALRAAYQQGITIQAATFRFVHQLFEKYGLIVLIADDARLKKQMIRVFEEDLFQQRPSIIVEGTCNKLSEQYNVQANPREINLFYLKDDIRERIVKQGDEFIIHNTKIKFTSDELKKELEKYPERFSPNVILRGLYQETILPNLAFIGGGGELAYWLQLKELFAQYSIVYPILILRNSFLIVEEKWQNRMQRLGLTITDFFLTEAQMMKKIVTRFSERPVSLNGKFEKAEQLFKEITEQTDQIDPTLSQHVAAIKSQSIKILQELEKKMFRAERRKFQDQQRQAMKIKHVLFPKNGLQERIENINSFYSKWGSGFIDQLYENSLTMEMQFVILTHQKS
jgi:bacillithiol biosynthesis cysteine-adding enzyme BshC